MEIIEILSNYVHHTLIPIVRPYTIYRHGKQYSIFNRTRHDNSVSYWGGSQI